MILNSFSKYPYSQKPLLSRTFESIYSVITIEEFFDGYDTERIINIMVKKPKH